MHTLTGKDSKKAPLGKERGFLLSDMLRSAVPSVVILHNFHCSLIATLHIGRFPFSKKQYPPLYIAGV